MSIFAIRLTLHSQWESLIQQAGQNATETLENPDNLRILANVLKTNVAACTSIGSFFTPQIALIYVDMLGLYRLVSGIISETVQKDGMNHAVAYFKDTYALVQA